MGKQVYIPTKFCKIRTTANITHNKVQAPVSKKIQKIVILPMDISVR